MGLKPSRVCVFLQWSGREFSKTGISTQLGLRRYRPLPDCTLRGSFGELRVPSCRVAMGHGLISISGEGFWNKSQKEMGSQCSDAI